MSPVSAWKRLRCRATFRHLGRIGWSDGPFWMCDNCGEVIR